MADWNGWECDGNGGMPPHKPRHPIEVVPGKLLVCGIHSASQTQPVRNTQERQAKPWVYRKMSVAWGHRHGRPDYHGRCICDYTDFPRLYDERVDAQLSRNNPFAPPHHEDKASGFFRLPAELRYEILEQILVSKHPVEFCPVAKRGPNPPRHVPTVSDAFKLMRVCKVMQIEVSNIFFARNEFRFTNSGGWVALMDFLYRINIDNARLLRTITVCHPYWLDRPYSHKTEDRFFDNIIKLHPRSSPTFTMYKDFWNPNNRYLGYYKAMRWFDHLSEWYHEPLFVLQKLPHLRNLNLVIPSRRDACHPSMFGTRGPVEPYVFLEACNFIDYHLSAERTPHLNITLALLDPDFDFDADQFNGGGLNVGTCDPSLTRHYVNSMLLVQNAPHQGNRKAWRFAEAMCNKKGRYVL